jgi:hypothetical protein
MENQVQCSDCKTLLPDDSALPDEQRTPCPKCGSKGRIQQRLIIDGLTFEVKATGKVISYPQTLLSIAKGLIDRGQFGIAIIVCHMACEVAVERALSASFAARGIADLEEPVEKLLNGFNLGNHRTRKLYTALTKDQIEVATFWNDFTASAERRNKIIHRGATADKGEAEKSFKAASSLVGHLKQ